MYLSAYAPYSLIRVVSGSSPKALIVGGTGTIAEIIIARGHLTAGCSGFILIGGQITVKVEFPKPIAHVPVTQIP